MLIETDRAIDELLRATKTIAVLGIKTEAQAGQPAFDVPRYTLRAGYDVIPVPVYYPDFTTILGRPVYRKLADVPEPIDMVNVFRRPADIPAHVADILAANPRSVWMQLGIRNEAVATTLSAAGIQVVQDRCLLVELQRIGK